MNAAASQNVTVVMSAAANRPKAQPTTWNSTGPATVTKYQAASAMPPA